MSTWLDRLENAHESPPTEVVPAPRIASSSTGSPRLPNFALLDRVHERRARLRDLATVKEVRANSGLLKQLLCDELLGGVAGDAVGVVVLDQLLQQRHDPADPLGGLAAARRATSRPTVFADRDRGAPAVR